MTWTNLVLLALLNIFRCQDFDGGVFGLVSDFLIADRLSMHLGFHLFALVYELDLFGEGLNGIFIGFNLIVGNIIVEVVNLFSKEVVYAKI